VSRARRLGVAAALVVAAGFLSANPERFVNRVEPGPLPGVGAAARALHASAAVVDLHADSLLFGRDLLRRSELGHVDLPRLREGGVALQVFGAPTRVPLGFNVEATDPKRPDLLTLLGAQRLAPFAWHSPFERALDLARQLDLLFARARGALVRVRTRAHLDELLAARERARRQAEEPPIGALLGIEGAHALDGRIENLDRLFDAGYRMIGLTHFIDNEFAGSAHGSSRAGLSEPGRELVRRMQQRGVIVDVAHASPTAIRDVLEISTAPVVVSHGGVRATCDNPRNLSDDEVRGIARTGGVIGIGFWETAVCGIGADRIAAAMRHVIAIAGEDHVALGSDFDGGTTTRIDASQLAVLTQQLQNDGVGPDAIRKVLGGNALRVFRDTLPPK
jgi:microsomal dipeptidase-like Zn-dependent dipeptidase